MQNLSVPLTLFSLALSLELVTASSLMAQTPPLASQDFWTNFVPPKNGTPDNTASGATRGECPRDNIPESQGFSSLLPQYIETNAARPTFSVHIPKTVAQKALFTLRDTNENYSYEREILLPDTPGSYSFQLPADAPAINANNKYQWSLNLICGQTVDPNDPRVGGVIQSVEFKANLSNQ